MFQSYTVVPVFVLAILFNFIYVFSDDDNLSSTNSTSPNSINFTSCNECLQSKCHKEWGGPCIPINDTTPNSQNSSIFQCLMCEEDDEGNAMYYNKEYCESLCHNKAHGCHCNGQCFTCFEVSVPNLTSSDSCNLPTQMFDDKCTLTNYHMVGL
ncbi:PREDICTED: uncharacterized protein LOC107165394 [Diuraphis noxia]|uniref:uncharacterized protein LOC107165394 n=1 Tax=Diuraphis noxia TaxID=143948 RepID=UPI000763A077|nr:PREDICTED: uncharacterized protein LOC107165394 [Diuraphis noxia]